MTMKHLMREIVDAVDGAGREFKKGFGSAFRKRGGKHRADADRIRGTDRRNSTDAGRHRRDAPVATHAKKYDMLTDVSRGLDQLGRTGRHAAPDYDISRDLGTSIGQAVRETPREVLDDVLGAPKKIPGQVVEELYEDAIGQDDPDAYGQTSSGDMEFLAPAGEASELRGLDRAAVEERFDLAPGALDGATWEVRPVPGTNFVTIDISRPED
ncbi:hypothetical protein KZX37_05260 [Microbacterium sp. EYE_5]|uniref:hypothetical protein n=1 Tax=unclassified Microbacterium TaxID=2609290 RepID=UPI0020043069|nr:MULTISPECIES: hypothetical protein [unclassified Microbacterium]MCK6080029.1 hypothetical protein [Microbacterium sp. EYE_382]MCK6085300.1 hypothetical protein [Microbacterium sp. EYE_384]MCK6122475.1 hypothetical protein [Microbacterium sp. EYE_80]MCK6126063.1 hypothetical protein [Microbacterium sp. EYE_79]MCK6140984.1 hypothetical protein [Microbacterium sp. EYE_39]